MDKINAMLELDRRGKLPEKFKPILEEYNKKKNIEAYNYTASKLDEQYRKEGKSVFETAGEFKQRQQKESYEANKKEILGPVTDAKAALKTASSSLYKQAGNILELSLKANDITLEGLKKLAPEKYLNAPQEDKTIVENYIKRLKESRKFTEHVRDKMYSFSEQVKPDQDDIRPGVPAAVNRAIVSSIPSIAEIASLSAVLGPTAAFTLLGVVDNADKGAKEMAIGGVGGALFGQSITALNTLGMGSRQIASSMLFGGQAALSGESTEEILAQAITGGVLGTMGPKEGPTFRGALKDRIREASANRAKRELERKLSDDRPAFPEARVGKITREEAVERLSRGDTSAVVEIIAARDILSPEIIKEDIALKARARATKNGTLDKFKEVENALRFSTKLSEESRANNASGESSASLEAQSRLKSEKAQGVSYGVIDTRSHNFTPLAKTVDTVDVTPGPNKVKVRIDKSGVTITDRGKGAEGYSIHPKTKFPTAESKVVGFADTHGTDLLREAATGKPTNLDKPIKISSVIEDMTKAFDKILSVDTRIGKNRLLRKKALGIYDTYGQMIRVRVANDFRVFSHEIGHHLHKILFGFEWPGEGLKSEALEPFTAELEVIATKNLKGQPDLPEGFAEFINLYLTNEVQAKTKLPKFYKHFESIISKDYPEIHNILTDAKSRYKLWNQQPAAAKILSKMSFDGDKRKFGFNQESAQDIYTWFMDDLTPLREFVKMVESNKKLNYLENPYIMARLFRGWMGKVESFLLKAPIDYASGGRIPNAKSLSDILKPVSKDLDYFRAYLYALRVYEQSGKVKNIGGKVDTIKFSISKAEAKEVIDGANVKMKEAANQLKTYHDSMLKYLIDSGIVSKESAIKMLKAVENYVPLYTVADDYHNAGGSKGTGKGITSLFDPIKRQKHLEGRDIVDPLESIIKNTYAFINLAEKQRVLKTFVNLANRTEGLAKYIDKIPTETKGIPIAKEEFMRMLEKYGKWEETTTFQEFKKELTNEISSKAGESVGSAPMNKLESIVREALMGRGFTKGEAEAYIHKLKESKGATGRDKVINQITEKHTISNTVKSLNLEDVPDVIWDIFRPANIDRPNVIKVYENGKKHYYEVNESIYRSLAALDKESVYLVSRILSFPAKMLRLGATTFSPEFALRNPMRDQWMAFIQSKYGYKPGIDFVRGLFHVWKKTDLYWQFKASGGEHSMLTSFDRNYLQSTLKEVINHHELASPVNIPFKTIRHPIEMLTVLSEYGEKATRMGEFAKATKKLSKINGLGAAEINARAGFASREVTLDFARMGAKGQAINAMVAFWNARLQGFDKIYRSFQEDPMGTTVRTIAAITVPQMLLYAAQYDNPIFQELPSWQKHMFFILVTGEGSDLTREQWDSMSSEEKEAVVNKTTVLRLPMPFELGVLFGGSVVAVGDYLTQKDPRALEEFMHDFIETASPGLPLPTAAVPAIEVWGNWSMFGNRPIVPKHVQELEPRYQASGYTSELSKNIGEAINYSPAKIDHLIRGYTGGFGGLALEGVDKAFEVGGIISPRPEKKTVEALPGVKGFIARFPNANTKSLRRFYVEYEDVAQKAKTYTALQKAGEIEEAEKYYEKNEKEINNSAAMDKVKEAFSEYHIMVREIFKDEEYTPEEKRKMIDEIYLEMTELADRALKNYDER